MAQLSLQQIAQGFGSYLQGIVPDDVAVGAGAFSASLRQIKNIESMPIEKLGIIAYNTETTKNLTVNGNGLPTDTQLAQDAIDILAKGNGPYSTYTVSNFLGCMSGLPYLGNFQTMQDLISSLSTPWLRRTYEQLYLAVTWKQATGTVTYTVYNVEVQPYNPGLGQPRIDEWYYTITGATITDPGGGYGRERTPFYNPKALDPAYPPDSPDFAPSGSYLYTTPPDINPAVTLIEGYSPSGTVFSTTIDSNSNNVDSTYGQVRTIYISTIGTDVLYDTTSVMSSSAPPAPSVSSPPTIEIEAPPTSIVYPPNYANYDSYGTSGWPTMDSVVNDYIDRANKEIYGIQLRSPQLAGTLNTAYDNIGHYLALEQESRSIALPQLPPQFNVLREPNYSTYPLSITTFVDNLYGYGLNTDPHMYSQTLEAITTNTLGGQSIVGLTREIRNQTRLTELGISLDNNIPNKLNKEQQKQLLYHGTLPLQDEITMTPIATLATSYTDTPIIVTPKSGTIPNEYNLPNNFGRGIIPPNLIVKNSEGGVVGVGALNKNPYLNIIPPNLNTTYTQQTVGSATYNVSEAIDQVVLCNCSCWDDL